MVDGRHWIAGRGPVPCDCMFIAEMPSYDSLSALRAYVGESECMVLQYAADAGIDPANVYLTYAVKYIPRGKKPPKSQDYKRCKPLLNEEIRRVNPKLIVAMGTSPLKMLFDNRYKITDYRGCVMPLPGNPECKVVTTFAANYIVRNAHMESAYRKDWENAGAIHKGTAHVKEDIQYTVVNKVADLRALVDRLIQDPQWLSLDCEWHGVTWMAPDRYVRTVQFNVEPGENYIVEFYSEGVTPGGEVWKPEYRKQEMDDPDGAMLELKRLFEHPNISVYGQNIISDGEWLLTYNIDIRPRTVYDTMLGEYLLNELGPCGLDTLSCKYTPYGRYDEPLLTWMKHHPKETVYGFGGIPRALILPYGAKDVEAPRMIMEKQLPLLGKMLEPRGKYPSLFQTTMDTQRNVYELELTGMKADVDRLRLISEAYITRLAELENQAKLFAAAQGMAEFNYRSTDDVRHLLFDVLKLIPIKTTDNKSWSKYIMGLSPEEQAEARSSTDKTSMMILQKQHPICKQLLQIKRLDTIVKTFLKEDEEADEQSRGGGLMAKIWPDGRFHTRFSQLSDTGRFKHRKPNSANYPKKGETYMEEIFGKGKVPPAMRSVVVPTDDDHVIMEADFIQAELFVLAGLSGDDGMMDSLRTPGKDMHDKTAVDSFGLKILNERGVELTSDDLVLIYKELNNKKYFDKFMESLTYVDQSGRRMSRKLFKNGIRVSAKNLNFGIPLKPWRN